MLYDDMLRQAIKYCEIIKPFCQIVKIGGSIRRKSPNPGDIEIVCIPEKYFLEQYFVEHKIEYHFTKNGGKYKQFNYAGYKIDLFICPLETWAMIYFIRTGSMEFVRSFMVEFRNRGYKSEDGYLTKIDNGKIVRLREEKDIFRFMGIDFVLPENRITEYKFKKKVL